MIQTERDYVRSLEYIIEVENSMAAIGNPRLIHAVFFLLSRTTFRNCHARIFPKRCVANATLSLVTLKKYTASITTTSCANWSTVTTCPSWWDSVSCDTNSTFISTPSTTRISQNPTP